MRRIGRGAQFGERNPNAVLNASMVRAIRRDYAADDISLRALARLNGVSHTTVRKAAHRITWKAVR
jgi:hypothetical protein